MAGDRKDKLPGADEQGARDFYRAAPKERVPPHLDDRVLQRATLEAGRDRWFGWMIPWLRPAAFAATIGLSLAVLLELSELSTPSNGLPNSDSTFDQSTGVVDGFNAAAEGSSDRIRSIGDNAAERKLQGDEVPTDSYAPADESATPTYCSVQESATAEAWQRCITELRRAGRDEAASTEILRFRKAHPTYPAQIN
jgi:hypothetical protein